MVREGYAADWPLLVGRVRLRCGGRCECKGCGAPHRGRCRAWDGQPLGTLTVTLSVERIDPTRGLTDANVHALCDTCRIPQETARAVQTDGLFDLPKGALREEA